MDVQFWVKGKPVLDRICVPRIADLLAKRAECFSLDRLALLAEQVGLNVRIRATRPYGGGGNSD